MATNINKLMEDSCNDEIAWAVIIATHAITQVNFENRVANFFGSSPEPRVIKSIDELLEDEVDCQTKSWCYNEDAVSNSQIDLSFKAIRLDHQYSIQLFKGLKHWFNADSCEFTLGKDASNRKDVIFLAKNGLKEVVYYANLGNLFP